MKILFVLFTAIILISCKSKPAKHSPAKETYLERTNRINDSLTLSRSAANMHIAWESEMKKMYVKQGFSLWESEKLVRGICVSICNDYKEYRPQWLTQHLNKIDSTFYFDR